MTSPAHSDHSDRQIKRPDNETPSPWVGFIMLAAIAAFFYWIIVEDPLKPAGTPSRTEATQEVASPTRVPDSAVDVTVPGNGASSQSYYLDGSYAVTITVYHSSEQCRLAVYARGPGDSIGSAIYQGVVVGNSGTFPEYSQTFDWDSEYFSEETVRIVSESACEKVRLQLRRE